jgi:hypothetical protein
MLHWRFQLLGMTRSTQHRQLVRICFNVCLVEPFFAAVYQFLPTPWDDPLVTSWAAPTYQHPSPMAQQVGWDLAAAAAPSQLEIVSLR